MKRTPLQPTEAEPVRPSTRDPIGQWLEVFTSLLGLPASEADRIRDELEDHLRTRVDDLLILGLSEPEAVQRAVTELGETAQLAQNFRSVRTHSRRRIAMHTALFAAVGLALAVGVAGVLPRSGTAPTPPDGQSSADAAAASLGTIEPVDAQPDVQSIVFQGDLEAGTLGSALKALAEAANARLFVHWSSMEQWGFDPDTKLPAVPAKGLGFDRVCRFVNSALGLEGPDRLTARLEDGVLEIGTVRCFDEASIVTVYHDLPSLLPSQHQLDFTQKFENLRNGVSMTVEPWVWRGDGAIGFIASNGSQIAVRAPERVQPMVRGYIARLEAAQHQRDEESRRESEEGLVRARADHDASVAALAQSLAEAHARVEALHRERDATAERFWRCEMEIKELESRYVSAGEEAELAEARELLIDRRVRLESLVSDRDRIQRQLAAAWERTEVIETRLASMQSRRFWGDEASGTAR